jgi:hypothetical protein
MQMKTGRINAIIALSLVLAAATAWTWKLHAYPKVGLDDSNIFFSYAENLVSGHGITYAQNGEPVEGFTSMLWMLMCTSMFAIDLHETGVFALCFILFVLTQVLILKAITGSSTQTECQTHVFRTIYLVLILSSPAYITWMTITLMDTCLWGSIVAGMALCLVLPPRSKAAAIIATLPFALAPLARPEALVVVPVFVVLLWFRCRTTGLADATRLCLLLVVCFVVVAAGVTAFRIHYFGYPFPNTYYAKVSPSLAYDFGEGKDYLSRFILSGPLVGVSCLLLLITMSGIDISTINRVSPASSIRYQSASRAGLTVWCGNARHSRPGLVKSFRAHSSAWGQLRTY